MVQPYGSMLVLSAAWEPQFFLHVGLSKGFLSVFMSCRLLPPERVIQQTKAEAAMPFMTYLRKSHIITITIFCWLHRANPNPWLQGTTQEQELPGSSWGLATHSILYTFLMWLLENSNYICDLYLWLSFLFYWTVLIWRIEFKPLSLVMSPSLLLPIFLFMIYHMLTKLENSLLLAHSFPSTSLSLDLFNSLTLCMHV